jgi:hypothetical protein
MCLKTEMCDVKLMFFFFTIFETEIVKISNESCLSLHSQRYHHYGKGPGGFQPSLFMVSLRVGARDFLGEGPTAQAARHDAASKALHQLKSLPLPEDSLQHCDAGKQENGKSSLKTTPLLN